MTGITKNHKMATMVPTFKIDTCRFMQIHGREQVSCHAGHQEVSRFTPKVDFREHVTCMPPPRANKTAHSGFESQRRYHQKSKTGAKRVFVLQLPFKKFGLIFNIDMLLAILDDSYNQNHKNGYHDSIIQDRDLQQLKTTEGDKQ